MIWFWTINVAFNLHTCVDTFTCLVERVNVWTHVWTRECWNKWKHMSARIASALCFSCLSYHGFIMSSFFMLRAGAGSQTNNFRIFFFFCPADFKTCVFLFVGHYIQGYEVTFITLFTQVLLAQLHCSLMCLLFPAWDTMGVCARMEAACALW